MYYVEAFGKLNQTSFDYVGGCGGIPLTYGSTADAIVLICRTLKFIESWLK